MSERCSGSVRCNIEDLHDTAEYARNDLPDAVYHSRHKGEKPIQKAFHFMFLSSNF